MRTGGDAGGSSQGGGRLTPRPDTLRPGTRAGSGPAPQSQIFIGRLVVIFGTGPNRGLFVYNGSPALGNPPVASIVAPGVTQDPYGNTILEGITSYSGSGAVQMDNGSVNFYGAAGIGGYGSPGNPGLISSVGATAILDLNSPLTPAQQAAGLRASIIQMQPGNPEGFMQTSAIQAVNGLGVGGESPHAAVLNANFAAGGTSPRYWRESSGTSGLYDVQMDGAINITGAVAANTTMFTMGANYHPARQFGFGGQVCNSAGLVLGAAVVTVDTGGNVILNPATGAGKFVLLDGIRFTLA